MTVEVAGIELQIPRGGRAVANYASKANWDTVSGSGSRADKQPEESSQAHREGSKAEPKHVIPPIF